MDNLDRLKELLAEAKEDVEKMDGWMKSQEPSPGTAYEDWLRKQQSKKTTQT